MASIPPPMTVSERKECKFSQLPLEEKVAIKKRGRPLPEIQLSQPGTSNNKKYIRRFNLDWYQKKTWLCGCETINALFCFPCILFGGENTWTKNGFKTI